MVSPTVCEVLHMPCLLTLLCTVARTGKAAHQTGPAGLAKGAGLAANHLHRKENEDCHCFLV